MTACGGGSSPSGGGSTPPPAALSITAPSILPGTLTNQPYSYTLTEVNGKGALHWSISPLSSTSLFVDGLSIDPSTGVVSGNANFSGTGGFIAQVTDSAVPARTASKSFTITASEPLQAPSAQDYTLFQYQDLAVPLYPVFQGGVEPFSYALNGCLAPGLRFDNKTGQISGSATALGNYFCTLTVQDSYSPPEVVTSPLTIKVVPSPLSVANSLPSQILLNRPFSGSVIATGGIPPYHFSVQSGSPPPGLSTVDPQGGQISGTPTTLGSYALTVKVTDSSSPAQSVSNLFPLSVTAPLGRNDTIPTATPAGNGSIAASLSPYIDPPDSAPTPNDTDYFKLVSISGVTVHLETFAQRSYSNDFIDTVIEVVDASGTRYTTCRQPGGSTFSSVCVNDDVDGSTVDSALDFQVPGPANSPTTFYVHVLDWRGDARPDLLYSLSISGLVSP
ncbi:MAG: hypothetical protein JST79_01155 [Acidobacteria bacterium]|nr:hypothetical protein [Acidobacteriota bacterium]